MATGKNHTGIFKKLLVEFIGVERIIREIRRRSRVIGVFPNKESYLRLITCYLIEYSEDWINERSYIKRENIIVALEARNQLLEANVAC